MDVSFVARDYESGVGRGNKECGLGQVMRYVERKGTKEDTNGPIGALYIILCQVALSRSVCQIWSWAVYAKERGS